ncbi:MAG TPA: trehalose-phosphatase [Terriglobales bacterium]|nr:trehalose-phosphatase [Terriglobales bacterium]
MLIAADFDGTLAPIVPAAGEAQALPRAAAALNALAERRDARVAVVSGRALSDLRARIPIPGCWYVGGHGNEISPELEPAPGHGRHGRMRAELAQAAERLRARMPEWPGAKLEAKPYSLAVHFRKVPEFAEPIRQAFSGLAAEGDFRVLLGRKVVELLPASALTKGHAVQRLRSRLGCDLAFYFGDDTTDEDVFALGDAQIIGVKVTHAESALASAAQCWVDAPAAVADALETILRLLQSRGEAGANKKLQYFAIPP